MAAPRNDNVKEKILDAATGLLNTQTFADISLAEIAAAAGVSKGRCTTIIRTRRISSSASPTGISTASGTI